MSRKELLILGLCGACVGLTICCLMFHYSYEGTKDAYDNKVSENIELRSSINKKDAEITSLKNELNQVKSEAK